VSPRAAPTPEFFTRLAGLPSAPAVAHAFERFFPAQTISRRSAELSTELHRGLLEHLLESLGLPRSAGGLNWEWRPLLLLAAEVDPHYFTEQQLERRLGECPPLASPQRGALLHALRGFLELRRSGLLERAVPWVSETLQQHWIALFPNANAWSALDVLRGSGLYPVGSVAGWRSYRRFTFGEFNSPPTPEALRAWQEVCWSAVNPREVPTATQTNAAHRLDFAAAAYAGDFAAAGLPGLCGEVPRCDACSLREDCAWATGQDGKAEKDGAAARARLGQLESLGMDHLLDGLFDMDPAERERLARLLRGESLRSLATKSAIELEEWLGADTGEGRSVQGNIGELNAERLLLLFEVCRRFGEDRLAPGAVFTQARDVYRHFRMRFRDVKQERFLVVLLDIKKRYLGDTLISQGGLDSSHVHPRDVFAAAVRERAAFVLLVHNHPSGDPAPSKADLETTRDLAKLGLLMGIPVIDHVILGEERFVSLRESGQAEL
jgi:DNA repair protein RadC